MAGDALAALGIPALVFDETGKVLSANALIEEMTGYVHWRAFDRVSLKDRAADQLLRGAIAIIDSEKGSGVRSFPIRDAEAEFDDGRACHSGSVVGARHFLALRRRTGDDPCNDAASATCRARAVLV